MPWDQGADNRAKVEVLEDGAISADTDPEMPLLRPANRAQQQEVRMSWTRAASKRAEEQALCNLTIDGLFDLAMYCPQTMKSLNGYMRRRYGVCIHAVSEKADGTLTTAVFENCPAPKRRCKWDGQRWTLSEILKWMLVRDATILWTLEYWERDFEPEQI